MDVPKEATEAKTPTLKLSPEALEALGPICCALEDLIAAQPDLEGTGVEAVMCELQTMLDTGEARDLIYEFQETCVEAELAEIDEGGA
jgi:hypothetical protein